MFFRVNKEMADFGFANFGDDDENEEEEFTFQVNEICILLMLLIVNCMKNFDIRDSTIIYFINSC